MLLRGAPAAGSPRPLLVTLSPGRDRKWTVSIKRFQSDAPMPSLKLERTRACDSCRRRKCEFSLLFAARPSSEAEGPTQLAVSRGSGREEPQLTYLHQAMVSIYLVAVVRPVSPTG